MYARIMEFVKENDILHNMQFGFWKRHSTAIALMLVTDLISKASYKGKCVFGIFLDFSKDYDTVIHEMLLYKPYCCGIKCIVHDWPNIYLSHRSQYVLYEVTSSQKAIACEVQHASILEPLLFYYTSMIWLSSLMYHILFYLLMALMSFYR